MQSSGQEYAFRALAIVYYFSLGREITHQYVYIHEICIPPLLIHLVLPQQDQIDDTLRKKSGCEEYNVVEKSYTQPAIVTIACIVV